MYPFSSVSRIARARHSTVVLVLVPSSFFQSDESSLSCAPSRRLVLHFVQPVFLLRVKSVNEGTDDMSSFRVFLYAAHASLQQLDVEIAAQ
jgi:hypothetical protein